MPIDAAIVIIYNHVYIDCGEERLQKLSPSADWKKLVPNSYN